MASLLLHGGTVLTPAERIDGGAVLVRDGAIEQAGRRADVTARADTSIDVQGRYICPGFIDLQVNGGGGALLTENPSPEALDRMTAAHLRFGTTAMLPTVFTAPERVLAEGLRVIGARAEGLIPQLKWRPGGRVLGAHLEGPFISPDRRGAHDPRFIVPPDHDYFRRLLEASGGTLRIITVAPELPGALDLIAAARRGGVIASIGHTDATYEQTIAGIDAGASFATHIFNAMRPLTQRDPGVAGALLGRDDIATGLIADGVHVHPAVLSLVARAKGPERTVLVTDAMPPVGSDVPSFGVEGREIVVRDGACYTRDGVLAGSALSMNEAVRRMRDLAGVPLIDSVRMATETPARVLGIDDLGVLRPGARADIVVCDEELTIWKVFVGGEVAYEG